MGHKICKQKLQSITEILCRTKTKPNMNKACKFCSLKQFEIEKIYNYLEGKKSETLVYTITIFISKIINTKF